MENRQNRNRVDNVGAGGYVEVEVWRDGKHGPVRTKRVVSHNLVVTCGKKHIWELVSGHKSTVFDQMRIGSGSAAATGSNVNVQTPIGGSLNTVDSKTMSTGQTFLYINSYPSGAGTTTGGILSFAAAKEVVLLCQHTSPGGTAMMRCVYTAVAKTKADKLKISYRIRIT